MIQNIFRTKFMDPDLSKGAGQNLNILRNIQMLVQVLLGRLSNPGDVPAGSRLSGLWFRFCDLLD